MNDMTGNDHTAFSMDSLCDECFRHQMIFNSVAIY